MCILQLKFWNTSGLVEITLKKDFQIILNFQVIY